MIRSEEHYQGYGVVYGFSISPKVARVTEKQVIGRRSKITQPDRFGLPDPQVSVDRIDQKHSTAAWALNITV